MKSLISLFSIYLLVNWVFGQSANVPKYTTAEERIDSYQKKKSQDSHPILGQIAFRSAGPTVFSGRVSDIDVSPNDPSHFYVAYASGGLWKTENNGTSFKPIFDREIVMSIGDIAVDWTNEVIWVGTGEVNSSRSSYSGAGIFKSTDGGNSWSHFGLAETHHIGRIILHPTDSNIAWVAALGHLYSANEERGIFKTTDGGNSWQQTLYVNENCGAVDLIINPTNPNELFAATWHRERRAWDFVEGGSGSGIYKSTDGGHSWVLLTSSESGFPNGEFTGRIGLDIHQQNGQTVLYASVDNYERRPKATGDEQGLIRNDLRTMDKKTFLELDKPLIQDYLRKNRFPRTLTAGKIIQKIRKDELKPIDLVRYIERPTDVVFETQVKGLEVYRSDNKGQSWQRTHEDFIDGVYSSFGYYFGQIRVAPTNVDKIYCLGVPVIRSDDGGKNFRSINGDNVHSDHHALWINPNRPGHLILGNDGGINISYDDGEHWIKCNSPALGQFYYIGVDLEENYNIYGGLQDNGTWYGSNTYEASSRWHGSGNYPYKRIGGGDGMQVAIDTRDNTIIYGGSQFGNYFRYNRTTGKRTRITPRHQLGETPYRWNWQTPIHLSKHNQDILYMGSSRVHRSLNQGNNFEIISKDLTKGGKKGDVIFGTLTAIHESPLKFGLLYTGSDDGLIHVSKNGGHTWENISNGLPKDLWVSRIIASQHHLSRVYAVLNGYRWDDFNPYLYQSDDYGKKWKKIGINLPLEPLNVVKEDPENKSLIYVGSDHGLYISRDGGNSFSLMDKGMPAVPVHDLVIHPIAHDLVVGTHGRSIYIANVKELQQIDAKIQKKKLHVFAVDRIRHNSEWGNSWSPWRQAAIPEINIPIYSNTESKATIRIKSDEGLSLKEMETISFKGLQYFKYDLSLAEDKMKDFEEALNAKRKNGVRTVQLKLADNGQVYLTKGKYTVEVEKSGEKRAINLELY